MLELLKGTIEKTISKIVWYFIKKEAAKTFIKWYTRQQRLGIKHWGALT